MSESSMYGEGENELLRKMVAGIAKGTVVPFLGAGVNCCGHPADFIWCTDAPRLPVGAELSLHLADVAHYPSTDLTERTNLSRVTQYMSAMGDPGVLRDELHELLVRKYEPTDVHRFFAGLPRLLREKGYGRNIPGFELVIVTTNYDELLEQAFHKEDVAFDVLVYRTENNRGGFLHIDPDGKEHKIQVPNEYGGLDLDKRPVIVKIHGAINRADKNNDSYVITEDDYIDYLAGNDLSNFLPAAVKTELINSHFLFLGYSLKDWNLRVFLKRIWVAQQKYQYASWAIQRGPEPIDRKLWGSRNVSIIGMTLEDFIGDMDARVTQLPSVNQPPLG